MKKSLNFLLILSIICFGITLVLNFCSIAFYEFDFKITNEVIDNVNDVKGNPGSGEYLIIAGTIGLFADFATGFAILFFLILIPFFMQIAIIIFQVISRLFQIGNLKNWKNTGSKVFTIISITVQILLCILLFFILFSNLKISKILMFISLTINITSVVVFIREFIKMNKINNQVVINQ